MSNTKMGKIDWDPSYGSRRTEHPAGIRPDYSGPGKVTMTDEQYEKIINILERLERQINEVADRLNTNKEHGGSAERDESEKIYCSNAVRFSWM